MTPTHPLRRPAALIAVLASLLIGACSSEQATTEDSPTTTTSASQFGSSMGVIDGTAADVAALGDGPPPGETWSVPVGLNVCGRFIEPIAASGDAGGPTISATDRGEVELTAGADGRVPTLGDYAELVGIELAAGAVTFPATAEPAVLDSTDPPTAVAGATLRDGDRCGGTAGAVQVWVYSAAARDSGDGILVVTKDTAAVPFAEQGMAVVISFSPESSLPTLPPSALSAG